MNPRGPTPGELEAAYVWLDELCGNSSDATAEHVLASRKAFIDWAWQSPSRIGQLLFLTSLHFQLRKSVQLWLLDDCVQAGACERSEPAIDACRSGLESALEKVLLERSLPEELHQCIQLTWMAVPDSEPRFWSMLHEPREHEREALREFLGNAAYWTCVVSGAWGVGKSTLIKQIARLSQPNVETCYVHIDELAPEIERTRLLVEQRFASPAYAKWPEMPQEMLCARVEAIIEKSVVCQLKRRCAEFYQQAVSFDSDDGPDALRYWNFRVDCHVAAAVKEALQPVSAWTEHASRRKRDVEPEKAAASTKARIAAIAERLSRNGPPRDLSSLLRECKVSDSDGPAWRRAYLNACESTQPVLVFDGLESLTNAKSRVPALQAIRKILGEHMLRRIPGDRSWKMIVATDDEASVCEDFERTELDSCFVIRLRARPGDEPDETRVRYLPPTTSWWNELLRKRVAFAARQLPGGDLLSREATSIAARYAPEGSSNFGNIRESLLEAAGPVAKALHEALAAKVPAGRSGGIPTRRPSSGTDWSVRAVVGGC